MSSGYFNDNYDVLEDLEGSYSGQYYSVTKSITGEETTYDEETTYGEKVENIYDQSQNDNGDDMDNYFIVQSREQAENNVFSHGGISSHIQNRYSDSVSIENHTGR